MGSLNYKEIMTGNFLHRGNWSVVKVVGTLPNDLIVTQGQEDDIQFTENISNLEPISLSSELLKNNNFSIEKFGSDPKTIYYLFSLKDNDSEVKILWETTFFSPDLQYAESWHIEIISKKNRVSLQRNTLFLHQLQNIFRLCNIEKEWIV